MGVLADKLAVIGLLPGRGRTEAWKKDAPGTVIGGEELYEYVGYDPGREDGVDCAGRNGGVPTF